MATCPVCRRETRLYPGEEIDPRQHCICPPKGPVWIAFAHSKRGRANTMLTAWRRYGKSMKLGDGLAA